MKVKRLVNYSHILKNLRIINIALVVLFLFSLSGCKYVSYEEDSIGYGVTLQGENLKDIKLYL